MTKISSYKAFLYACILMTFVSACHNNNGQTKDTMDNKFKEGSFGYDLNFLQKYDSVIVLTSGDAQIIVSPKYQAKVFTSTAEGNEGTSFGWVHYKAFDSVDEHMNAYGGENRIWLGPEGGKFSLFFKPESEMIFDNWKTPAAFDTEAWEVTAKDELSVTMKKEMVLLNYQRTVIEATIVRQIRILDRGQIAISIGVGFSDSIKAVGYSTENEIWNRGSLAWTETTGMPCIWILDMFRPSANTTIVIPYSGDSSRPATTDYFGEIRSDRIQWADHILYFKADGKSRGKIGIHPTRAKEIAGSWDAEKNILTISTFDMDNGARYLNQEWHTTKLPFSGDAVNAYNDGPLANGSQMGPFYELESVSPACFLVPGASLTHHHSVFHFTGDAEGLNGISQKCLGVSLDQIKKALL